jgi:Xaa-Pro aminopeptidase
VSFVQLTDRAGHLIALLPEAEIDLMLVTDLVNVRYLTGYTGSNGMALVGPQTRAFITDFRYVQQAAEQVDESFESRQAPLELLDTMVELLPAGKYRLGFEAAHVSVRDHSEFQKKLPDHVELVPVEGLVEGLRAVKDPEEQLRIGEAAKLADVALRDLLAGGLVGRTERQVAIDLEAKLRHHGAERPSFETIIAAGPHGALPHATPRDVEIKQGELVVIDWGAQLDGYCSDCTRTLAAGEPGAEEREVYGMVLTAQLAGVGAVRSGAPARDVDSAARDVITQSGHGEHFGHGLGHGVGLAIHEGPRLSQRSDAVLEAGNVVTVEPGIYLPDRFGVRIEDLLVVTEGGHEILTSIPKELTVTG